MASVMERWEARAEDPDVTPTQRAYAARRARKLSEPWSKRVEGCARAGMRTRCGCKGTGVTWYTCRQHLLCRTCRKQRARRYGVKMWRGLEAAMAKEPDKHLVLVTLTVRPSGDLRADRAALVDGWREYYRANHRRWGRFSYVGVVELHRSGVPHLHVVAVWPRGAPGDNSQGDWQLQCALWRSSCPQSERVSYRASRTPGKAARYVAKYVSKGVQDANFTPKMRAEVIAATYNTRWVLTSAKFWESFKPVCPCCRQPIVRARFKFPDAPPCTPLERLRGLGWSTRGDPDRADGDASQLALALADPNERAGIVHT